MGGVDIYSNRYPYTDIVRHGENGLLVDDTPKAWCDGLQQLLEDPVATALMTQQTAKDAQQVGDLSHTVSFWQVRSERLNNPLKCNNALTQCERLN